MIIHRSGVLTALLIPTLILLMVGVKQHYTRVKREVGMGKLNLSNLQEPLVVIPMARWDRMTLDQRQQRRFRASLCPTG